MTRALAFDGDSAYYESLAAKVRADEAAKQAESDQAAAERRKSIGLPENEHEKKQVKEYIPFGWGVKNGKGEDSKKSAGEIVASVLWGNRSK